jgi:uncharacterized protein
LIRAVIDTNILIRALIKPQGSVGTIIAALRSHRFELILSWPLLEELAAKIALPRIQGKYHLTDLDTYDYMAFLSIQGKLVEPREAVRVCRDAKDNMVLEAALTGKAQFIVTSDEDLLVLNPFGQIEIVTAGAFLRRLGTSTAYA